MKIAFISDIHGNYLALDLMLRQIKEKMNISDIYFLGDAVGYFPEANKVVSRLRSENIFCLMGNHEAMLLGLLQLSETSDEIYKLNKTKKEISDANYFFIKQLLPFYNVTIDKYNILMVHGSPFDPLNGYVYENSDFNNLPSQKYNFIFMGHTHRPYILKKNNTTYINVGSCGLPRDVGSLASFSVLDIETGSVNVYRLPLNRDLIINEYSRFVHSSVIECLQRDNNKFNGELII